METITSSNLTREDLKQIKKKGISTAGIEEQLKRFTEGFPPLKLVKPATINDGITVLNDERKEWLEGFYGAVSANKKVIKFVPASGAASRMFKHLHEYYKGDAKEMPFTVRDFFNNIDKFAFYEDLERALNKDGLSIPGLLEKEEYKTIIDYLLTDKGLEYANLPKAMIEFHKYDGEKRTALDEHLIEAVNYCMGMDNTTYLHFTVSPEHRERINNHLRDVIPVYEKEYMGKFNIELSEQKSSTDTIAVDMDNRPFRTNNNQLLFRPGGHGALLENLNELNADIAFIKNIDNVLPDYLKKDTIDYKRILGGYLLDLQNKIFGFLDDLEQNGHLNDYKLHEIIVFSESQLGIPVNEEMLMVEGSLNKYLFNRLNRPIRVCGMVKNIGEPGGGPFWVKDKHNNVSLQIVEKAQVNLKDEDQAQIFKASTHFNPVDIVCGLKNFKGEKFDLLKFRDPETGFITKKSKEGKPLKALELPGLWNGSMADWITLFVEVPLSTFSPVKTVNDLLKKEHQPA